MMNSQTCVDASVVVKLVLREPESDLAQALWADCIANEIQIIAPYHLAYEMTSVIRNRVHRGEITAEYGRVAFETLNEQQIYFWHPSEITRRAWALAEQFKRPTLYDSFYLALSEIAGCELWTADRRLYNVVTHALPWVKWLGDFRPVVA
jgi:predicted nucleic acid-binding protein